MAPKSGIQRAKAVDYDDNDDYYDDEEVYDEDGGTEIAMTEDDREQMRVGTIRVRAALGDGSHGITDAQIQEALWHYYYDIEKSVVYLKNKFSPETKSKAPTKHKAASRFDQAAQAANQKAPTTPGKQSQELVDRVGGNENIPASSLLLHPWGLLTGTSSPASDFFWDIPWGNAPPHRLGEIIIDRPYFRGGLLGGSSKLAALAAKRRKQREESKASLAPATPDGSASKAIAMLDKLSVKDGQRVAPAVSGEEDSQRATRGRYSARKRSASPMLASPAEGPPQKTEAEEPAIVARYPAKRSQPSSFASILCGESTAAAVPPDLVKFIIPYVHQGKEPDLSFFNDPSPEDIVQAAQAKSAGGGRH